MATFRGILEVEGDPDSSLVADIEVTAGRISLKAGGTEIGDWDLNDIAIEPGAGGFRLVAEDEALFLTLNDAKRFAGHVGVDVAPSLEDEITPGTAATPTTRAQGGLPRENDLHVEPTPDVAPVPEKSPTGVPRPDESPLARRFSWSLVGAAAILFLGALLDWGPWQLTDANFPIARALIVIAGFAAFAAAYLGLALEKRRDVALVALLSGLISILVLITYARRAAIGYGFIVTILGTLAVLTIAVLALTHLGAGEAPADKD